MTLLFFFVVVVGILNKIVWNRRENRGHYVSLQDDISAQFVCFILDTYLRRCTPERQTYTQMCTHVFFRLEPTCITHNSARGLSSHCPVELVLEFDQVFPQFHIHSPSDMEQNSLLVLWPPVRGAEPPHPLLSVLSHCCCWKVALKKRRQRLQLCSQERTL